jgi:hypothetical protein
MYDEASSYEGYRNAFIALLLISSNIGRALSWLLVLAAAELLGDYQALQVGIVAAIFIAPLRLSHNYKELKI